MVADAKKAAHLGVQAQMSWRFGTARSHFRLLDPLHASLVARGGIVLLLKDYGAVLLRRSRIHVVSGGSPTAGGLQLEAG